jgi:hypothetical protein
MGFSIPEDDVLHSHCRENLKYCIFVENNNILASFSQPPVNSFPLRPSTLPLFVFLSTE